jgi:hypothetical protein
MSQVDLFAEIPPAVQLPPLRITLKPLEKARAERDIGIERAAAHGENDVPDWKEVAFQFIRKFVRERKGPFIAHDVVTAAAAWGLATDDARAWGAPIRRAVKEGLLVQIGYVAAPHRHCSPVPQYRGGL